MLGELFERARRAGEADVLDPAVQSPDAHRLGVVVPRQTPVVVGMRRFRAEDDRLRGGLAPPPGSLGAEVPGPYVRAQRRVRISHAFDDVLRGLRPETTVLQLAVTQLPQFPDAALELEILKGDGGDPVRGLVDRGQGPLKRRCLRGIRHELHLRDDLHSG
ncbi:hypothetical protein [Actinomadura alba]|uniref:hypothetical protein n=1 Tax=Actinomadura alba TaxID=406431 RepID=UPI001FE54A69|nr:hypothetical protein [Actinomadura alba]